MERLRLYFASGLIILVSFASSAFGAEYWGSKTSFRYHDPGCKWAKTIKSSNVIRFPSPREAALAGYVPCPVCKPPKAADMTAEQRAKESNSLTSKAKELYDLGKGLSSEGRCGEALGYFERAAKEDPGFAQIYLDRGICRNKLGDLNGALDDFRQAVRLEPRSAFAHYSLGVLYYELKRYESAIDAYKQAIRLNPRDAFARCNLGITFGALLRYEDAVEAFNQAIRINPDVAQVYINLGVAYSNLGRYEEAVQAFREAIRRNPDDSFAHYNLGMVHMVLSQHKEAVDSFRRATLLSPDDELTIYQLAVAYLRAGDKESSFHEYESLKRRKSPMAMRLYHELQRH